jgi:hypothetical protein
LGNGLCLGGRRFFPRMVNPAHRKTTQIKNIRTRGPA